MDAFSQLFGGLLARDEARPHGREVRQAAGTAAPRPDQRPDNDLLKRRLVGPVNLRSLLPIGTFRLLRPMLWRGLCHNGFRFYLGQFLRHGIQT